MSSRDKFKARIKKYEVNHKFETCKSVGALIKELQKLPSSMKLQSPASPVINRAQHSPANECSIRELYQ